MNYHALAVGVTYELYEYLNDYLMGGDVKLTYALTVTQGIRLFAEQPYHLIIIDLQGVQKVNRLELLEGLRKTRFVPILALTDQATIDDTARILDYGVDVCLPNDIPPLLIRKYAKSLIRRYTAYNHYGQPESVETAPFRVGDIYIDPLRRTVQVRDEPVDLRPREFALLLYFMQNPGIVLTSDQIFSHAWGRDGGYEHSVGQAVSDLRRGIKFSVIYNASQFETHYKAAYSRLRIGGLPVTFCRFRTAFAPAWQRHPL